MDTPTLDTDNPVTGQGTLSVAGEAHEAPGPDRFIVRGQSFEFDVLDTYYEFENLAQAYAEAGREYRAVLAKIIRRIQERHGVGLTYGEAD